MQAHTIRQTAWLLPLGVTMLLLILWQSTSGRLFNAYFLSKPTDVWSEIAKMGASGSLVRDILVTLRGTLAAFCIAALSGVTLALIFSENELADEIIRPFVTAAFAVPFIALAPLLVAWLGVGFLPAMTVACVSAFFMVFFSAYSGLRGTSPALLDIATLMGATGLQRALLIKLPAALPFLVEGLYTGLIYAFHGEVVGEMLAANSGLGYAIAYAASQMNAAGVIAGLAVLGILAYGLIALLDASYKKFVPAASAPPVS